ncbi:Cj0814 family flagellar-dependent secreted protein [Campylobacter sp. RM12647]|uniref:Cj0814 family flagellar-dependent secreted protein n=1 Tax=Campylobacter sp. RM12647 TaxID=2735737 RepID=UPI001DC78A06|nr:hypothetical protein [Campylobacter sp. RM12647]
MKINSYSTYQITNISKKETNNEIKKVDNKADDKKVGVVLGYGVDKDGFFTSDFNKAAGIPEDFKIHSDTMLSLVEKNNQANPTIYKMRHNIDIVKSASSAYKVLKGVLGDEFLNSKDFFSSDELWKTSHFFEMDKRSLTITKTFDKLEDYQDYVKMTDYCRLDSKYRATNYLSGLFAQDDIFHKVEPPVNNYDAWLDSICSFIYDPHKENYQNEQGEYSKGGLLAAVLYNNYILVEGEKTNYAKQMGHDYSDPFDPYRTDDDWGMIKPNNTKRYEIGKEDEWQKLMQKLLYEMLSGKNLKAPKDIDNYETFEEFLQAALQYSQKNISLFDIKV